MELFVFLDLDDTIFQTQRKCPEKAKITPAAFLKDGSPISFFTEKQQRLFNLLQAKTRLIPTTARNKDAFYRACVEQFDYAIITHGGIILNADGSLHSQWFELMESKIKPLLPKLQALEKQLQNFANKEKIPYKIRLIEDFGLTFYLSVKHQHRDNQALKLILDNVVNPYLESQKLDFYCHLNDNNLAILPKFLNKAPAVSYLQQQLKQEYKEYLSFGMGDSLTDMPYMQLCDYFITPTNSQIMRQRLLAEEHEFS